MPDPSDRDALIEQLVEQFRRQLSTELPHTDQTLDQIEDVAGRVGQQISAELQKRLAQQQANRPPRPKRQTCGCGALARYKGQQTRSLVTLHGVLPVCRAVYYCRACQKSLSPADARLGLDAGSTTTSVRQRVAYLAALLPFAQAATTLERLNQVRLSPASVERIACVVGTALRQTQCQDTQAHHADRLPEPTVRKPRRLYIGMDGVFVPLREAWKRDQSAGDLQCRYGECKLGLVYETKQDKDGQDSYVKTRAYTATLANAEAFGPLLATLAHQQGHHQTQDVVVLADGAPWIWQIAAKQFTRATQIVDFFHASAHLAQVGAARFGAAAEEAKAWLGARQAELLADDLALVLADLQAWRPRSLAHQELRRRTYGYFHDNAKRMRYKTFREQGYLIGSGVVEAGCKQVATQRMKQAGMHWRQETAEAILTLRAAQLSTYPPDLRPYCAMPA